MHILQHLEHLLWSKFKSPEPQSSSSDVLAFVDFAERIVLSANQNSPLLRDLNRFRNLRSDEQERDLAGLYLVIEQYLTEVEANTAYNRRRLRTEIRKNHSELFKLRKV